MLFVYAISYNVIVRHVNELNNFCCGLRHEDSSAVVHLLDGHWYCIKSPSRRQ